VKERDRLMEQGGYSLPAEFDRLQTPSGAYAPRQVVTYLCTREHLVTVPFAAEAEVPDVWDCRCGQPATRVVAEESEEPREPVGSGEPRRGAPVGQAPVDRDEASSAAAE
jgi:hypothetical protein